MEVAIKSQLKTELCKLELYTVYFLLGAIAPLCGGYEKFDIMSIPTNYRHAISLGDTFKTEILFFENAGNQIEQVLVDGDTLKPEYYGRYQYKKKLDEIGEFEAEVAIIARDKNNQLTRLQKRFTYQVKP